MSDPVGGNHIAINNSQQIAAAQKKERIEQIHWISKVNYISNRIIITLRIFCVCVCFSHTF